jgi:flagellar basal body-associated protein FliL
MSDEMEDLDTGDDGDSGKSSKKRAGGASGLIKILTMIVGVILVLVFTVTVSVITYNIMNKNNSGRELVRQSDVYTGVPDYDYTEPIEIRGRTSDRVPKTFMVTVVLGYDIGDEKTLSEIARRRSQLQDLMRSFFSDKRVEDFNPSNEQQLKAELQQRINRILSQGRIRTILFTEFLIDL